VAASNVAVTLAAYLLVYVALLFAYVSVLRYLARKPPHANKPVNLAGKVATGVNGALS
jgi:cytochrome bd-type quinol oxidase subunit 1